MAELLLGFLFSGALGYALGISRFKGFEILVEDVRRRVDILAYFRVIPPLAAFRQCNIPSTFYKEAVQAYLLGMPNSSVVMSLKTLELGLKCKLGKRDARLKDLIDEVETMKEYKDLAHGFRILRNFVVHEEVECKEQDALEALRHVSEILNRIYPFKGLHYPITCSYCGTQYGVKLSVEEYFLGNVIRVPCPKCKSINTIIVGAEWGVPQIY